jgi:glycosyltransferase involved in cell wall biosynthesis
MERRNMKIALINGKFGGVGGSAGHVYNLHKWLKDKCEFQILDSDSVGYINIPKLKSISFYRKLKKIKIDADIIHVHNPKFGGIVKDSKKSILTMHGDFAKEFINEYGILGKSLSNHVEKHVEKFDTITTVNPYWAKTNNWDYIPNGISLNDIENIKSNNEKYVLFVGRKDSIKGYEIFEKMAKKVPFATKMLFDKPWEEVISLMKSAQCIVMPSKIEGFPSVILEAWACGCPVVASNIPELNALSKDAIYFSERTVDDFTEAVHKVIDENVGKIFSERGLEQVKEYDWGKVSQKYYELYCKVYEN